MLCNRLIAGCLHQIQQLRGCVPVADRHALVNRQSDDAAHVALGCLVDEYRKIKHASPCESLVDSLFGGDTLHGLRRGKGLFQKNDIVAVGGWIAAEAIWCTRHNYFHLLMGSDHHT
jgi:hypothetical protein